MAQRLLTADAIQGRINQREVPWLATASSDDRAVTFRPKDGAAVFAVWDQTKATRTLDEIVDWLASYKSA